VYAPYPVYDSVETIIYDPVDTAIAAQPSPEPALVSYWYYCTDPAGYYPYVQNCTKPWIPVAPQSVPSAPAPSANPVAPSPPTPPVQ
jgi:hypothetical protein